MQNRSYELWQKKIPFSGILPFTGSYLIKGLCTKKPRPLSRYSNQAVGWTAEESWFDSLMGKDILSLFQSVQTDSGAHPTSYQMGTGSTFRASEVAGASSHCSPSSTVVHPVALRPFLIGPWSLLFHDILISISSI
jgi:hypothetical protein